MVMFVQHTFLVVHELRPEPNPGGFPAVGFRKRKITPAGEDDE